MNPPFFALLVAQKLDKDEITELAGRMAIKTPTRFYQEEQIWGYSTLIFLKSAESNFYLYEYCLDSEMKESVLYGSAPKTAGDVLKMKSLSIFKEPTQRINDKLRDLFPTLPATPGRSSILRDYWYFKLEALDINICYAANLFEKINFLVVLKANLSLLVDEFLIDHEMFERKVDPHTLIHKINFDSEITVVRVQAYKIEFKTPVTSFKDLETTGYVVNYIVEEEECMHLDQLYVNNWSKITSLGQTL